MQGLAFATLQPLTLSHLFGVPQELQATLATYVERGAGLEAEALQSLGRSLPQELTSALPMEVQDALRGGTAPAVTTAQPGASTTPLAEQELVNPSSLVDYQVGEQLHSACCLCISPGAKALEQACHIFIAPLVCEGMQLLLIQQDGCGTCVCTMPW